MSLGDWLLSGTSSLLTPVNPSPIKPKRNKSHWKSETQHAPLNYYWDNHSKAKLAEVTSYIIRRTKQNKKNPTQTKRQMLLFNDQMYLQTAIIQVKYMWKFKHATFKLRQKWRELWSLYIRVKKLRHYHQMLITLQSSMRLLYIFLHLALVKADKIFNM